MAYQFDQGQTLDDLLHIVLNAALVTVNASAGSIMMLDQSKQELHIKARLGPPRKGRTHEPVFKVEDNSIASKVAREGKPSISPNVNQDPSFLQTRQEPPVFRSLLSVPIKAGNEVLGVINADHEHEGYFTDQHKDDLAQLACDVGPIIAGRISLPKALRQITAELTRDTTYGDIEKTLIGITNSIKAALGADVVILYQFDHELQEFIRTRDGTPIISGELRYRQYMNNPVYPTDVPWKILKREVPVYIPNVQSHDTDGVDLTSKVLRKNEEHPERERFCKREGIRSLAALPLIHQKNDDEKNFVGVLFVNYRQEHVFNIDETDALEAFAEAAAFAILNARREESNRKEKTGLYYRINRSAHVMLNNQEFLSKFNGTHSDCFVMAVDIRRSTDLMLLAKTPEKYVEFMHALEDSLRSRILENYGIIDKFTGDGLVAHFPLFYSGEDAAVLCLKTAAECHREFEKIYAQKADCFIVTLADAALGIGVDFGKVHFAIRGQELIAVGTPVVYASRLSSVEGGRTVLNQQAWHIVHERYPTLVISQEKLKIPLKYQGECIAIAVQLQPGELCVKDPPWLR